jgi:NAD(P)-dependent dehydrogenase (short-subunit alcohol dehydrogenase family)
MTEALFPPGAALIVGGSGGIGRHIALEFARSGADVAITYNKNAERAQSVADEIRALDRQASVHQLTVGDADRVRAVLEDADREHRRVHTIVYAAATLTYQVLVAEITTEQWRTAVNQDLNGFFNVISVSLPRMRAAGGGSFVNIGSAGDLRWPERDALSVVPKAAIESLIRGVAKEEGRHNIRANSVLVGVIEAGMFLELTRSGALDAAWVTETQKMLALKRWGQPAEIGQAAVFLASNRAAYVTGQQLAVAGGFGL